MADITCTTENPCTAVQLINASIISDRNTNKEWREKTDKVLDKLQNRLPPVGVTIDCHTNSSMRVLGQVEWRE